VTDGTPLALSVRGLSKRFGATRALRDVDIDVMAGHVHAIVGGNGSGKSTTVKVLAGIHQADTGTITVRGRRWDARQFTPAISRGMGLRFLHQDLGLFPGMTVAENLGLGTSISRARVTPVRWAAVRRDARLLLDRFELALRPDDRLGDLRPSEQTMVAVARALNVPDDQPAVLVMDEPTASLPGPDADLLLAHLRRHSARGQTVIYISHRLAEVRVVADSVTVLRDGRHVVTAAMGSLTQEQLVDHLVGPAGAGKREETASASTGERPMDANACDRLKGSREGRASGPAGLTVSGLRSSRLKDLDLTVGEREIVGLTGLAGSGFDEPLNILFGLERASAGVMRLDGREFRPRGPRDALAEKLIYSPADRHREGCFLDLQVRTNLTAPRLRAFWRRGWLSLRRERADAEAASRSFGVRAGGVEAEMGSLSGGNQQKVVLARWLALTPRLLLLAEPTQGVDVVARAEIYARLRATVNAGASVLLSSTDLDELVHMCDRVLVLSGGRVVDEYAAPRLDVAELTRSLHRIREESVA
jgi:ribose transport system ATP-binding protein